MNSCDENCYAPWSAGCFRINSVLPYPRLARWSAQKMLGETALPTCAHIQHERLALAFLPTILTAINKEYSVKGKKCFHLFPIRKTFQTEGVLLNLAHCVPMDIKHWVYAVDSWKLKTLFKAAALNIINTVLDSAYQCIGWILTYWRTNSENVLTAGIHAVNLH